MFVCVLSCNYDRDFEKRIKKDNYSAGLHTGHLLCSNREWLKFSLWMLFCSGMKVLSSYEIKILYTMIFVVVYGN